MNDGLLIDERFQGNAGRLFIPAVSTCARTVQPYMLQTNIPQVTGLRDVEQGHQASI